MIDQQMNAPRLNSTDFMTLLVRRVLLEKFLGHQLCGVGRHIGGVALEVDPEVELIRESLCGGWDIAKRDGGDRRRYKEWELGFMSLQIRLQTKHEVCCLSTVRRLIAWLWDGWQA